MSLPLVLSGWVASEAVGRSVLRALVVLGVALLSFDSESIYWHNDSLELKFVNLSISSSSVVVDKTYV